MQINQYITTILCVLWNIIIFLCPNIASQSANNRKKLSFYASERIDTYFNPIFLLLKELKKKIISNKNNKADATSVKVININKKQVLNIFDANNTILNQVLKNTNLLSYLRLKDAQATQNLISSSKQHFIPLGAMIVVYQSLLLQLDLSCIKAFSDDLKKVMTITQDKCAYFFPFCTAKASLPKFLLF